MKQNKKIKDTYFYRFVAKCSRHGNIDLSAWTEYEFLGYFAKSLGYNLQPSKEKEPRKHDQLLAMTSIILHFVGVKSEKGNWKKLPAEWNRQIVKDYLDWHIERLQDYNAHTPELINNARNFFEYDNRHNEPVVKKKSKKAEEKIERSTELPSNVKNTLSELKRPMNTYGDLHFMMYIKDADLSEFWTALNDKHNITQDFLSTLI